MSQKILNQYKQRHVHYLEGMRVKLMSFHLNKFVDLFQIMWNLIYNNYIV